MSSTSVPKCPDCGCTDIDHDPARGDAVCVECGKVLQDVMIVAEVAFQEDGRGRAQAIGQRVNAEGHNSRFSKPLHGHSMEARKMAIDNARRRMKDLCHTLRIADQAMLEQSMQYFKLAFELNFHKGRRLTHVCAACLYVTCRYNETSHMLLDFSDALSTNVYVLGHTYLKFRLSVIQHSDSRHFPVVDPSLYVHRFVNMLEFGAKNQTVAMTALRILSRMRRDFMSDGRRPAGLCGAAIIIAARMHNFYRTKSEVVKVVRAGSVVLRNRLREVLHTHTARLTGQQIERGGGESGHSRSLTQHIEDPALPPAYSAAVARRAAHQDAPQDAPPPELTERSAASEGDGEETVITGGSLSQSKRSQSQTGEDDNAAHLEAKVQEVLDSAEMQQLDMELREEAQLDGLESGAPTSSSGVGSDRPRRRYVVREAVGRLEPEGDLSDLDDEDARQYLNTEEEFKRKEVIWQEMNKDYLERQEYMERLKRERPEEYKRLRPSRAKRQRKNTGPSATSAPAAPSSASLAAGPDLIASADATIELPEKRSSQKINYAALDLAFQDDSDDDNAEATT